jgi:hypothetical protein
MAAHLALWRRASAVLALLLAAPAAAACDDGTATYAAFASAAATYFAATAANGAAIGARSEGCALPVTPRALTFSIWGYVYSHAGALLAPGALPPEEMHHLAATFDESRAWLDAFAGGGLAALGGDAPERSNGAALAAIEAMECHVARAARHACEVEPRAFACCAHTQHATWLRVARLLSALIVDAYGDACGTPRLADAEVEARFAAGFAALVDDAPAAGVDGAALRAWRTTLAWAWRGVCEARAGGCPAVPAADAAALAAIAGLRDQGDVGFAGALVCTPAVPPA